MTDPLAPPDGDEVLLTRQEASVELARYGIRMKAATLARAWSVGSDGPPCRHVRGKPLYPRERLRAWAAAQITGLAGSARERDLQRWEARRAPRP